MLVYWWGCRYVAMSRLVCMWGCLVGEECGCERVGGWCAQSGGGVSVLACECVDARENVGEYGWTTYN